MRQHLEKYDKTCIVFYIGKLFEGEKMQYVVEDKKYRFRYAFDSKTGAYIRTGILDDAGKDTGRDPFMASYPHLIDVGIMGHCIHGKTGLCAEAGIGCYQSGMIVEEPNMAVEDFRWIAKQSRGKCNQFALGGRGDPDQHEAFEEILKICRENEIVPNFTTSGYGMTKEIAALCKEYCGAVAVSWYRSEYTLQAIRMLLEAGVKTNIHYVLGKNSIDEAIERLEHNDFPDGINAVIFLLHKPAGQGTEANVLSMDDERVARFFRLFDVPHPFKIGMDSCSVPGAIQFCKTLLQTSPFSFSWIKSAPRENTFFPGGKWQTEHSLPAAGEKSYQMASSSVQSENCSAH